MSLQKVLAKQDDSCHWYVIPAELSHEWNRLSEIMYDNDGPGGQAAEDLFIDTFGQYMTGGDLNNIQLYADL